MRRPRRRLGARLVYRELRGTRHDQMAHAVVAVEQRHADALAARPDARTQIEAAGSDASRVMRQPDHAAGVATAQIGLDHKPREDLGVVSRQAGGARICMAS